MWNKKNNNKKQAHKYREQIGGCGGIGWGKRVKEYTFPVIKEIAGDVMYSIVTIVNTVKSVLYISKFSS